MKVEKDEVSMGYFKTCDGCDEDVFDGMDIYYIEINKSRYRILLCENCMNKLYYNIDEVLGNEI